MKRATGSRKAIKASFEALARKYPGRVACASDFEKAVLTIDEKQKKIVRFFDSPMFHKSAAGRQVLREIKAAGIQIIPWIPSPFLPEERRQAK